MYITITFDTNKNIEQLENIFWKDELEFPSALVAKCHLFRKKPVGKLSIEELRLLISQNIGLPYLVPVALNILSENPFAEGDLYPGDLLFNVLTCEIDYWKMNTIPKDVLLEIIQNFKEVIKSKNDRRINRAIETIKLNFS